MCCANVDHFGHLTSWPFWAPPSSVEAEKDQPCPADRHHLLQPPHPTWTLLAAGKKLLGNDPEQLSVQSKSNQKWWLIFWRTTVQSCKIIIHIIPRTTGKPQRIEVAESKPWSQTTASDIWVVLSSHQNHMLVMLIHPKTGLDFTNATTSHLNVIQKKKMNFLVPVTIRYWIFFRRFCDLFLWFLKLASPGTPHRVSSQSHTKTGRDWWNQCRKMSQNSRQLSVWIVFLPSMVLNGVMRCLLTACSTWCLKQ